MEADDSGAEVVIVESEVDIDILVVCFEVVAAEVLMVVVGT